MPLTGNFGSKKGNFYKPPGSAVNKVPEKSEKSRFSRTDADRESVFIKATTVECSSLNDIALLFS